MSEGSALECSVLVLNRFYMAVRVVNVRRAMTLLYRGCAEVITIEEDQYYNYDFDAWCEISQFHAMEKQPGEDFIKAPQFDLQVPRIVRLTRYDRLPKSSVRFNRKNLFARDNHACQYCGTQRPMGQLSLDHVIPRSLGGKTTWENTVQAGMKLLSKPVKPSSNPSMVIPLTDPRYASWKSFLPNASAV
jgi:5-methylcytosine-specific restriction endonuclease McrA